MNVTSTAIFDALFNDEEHPEQSSLNVLELAGYIAKELEFKDEAEFLSHYANQHTATSYDLKIKNFRRHVVDKMDKEAIDFFREAFTKET